MDGRHCTSQELIETLYGVGHGGKHIRECAACAAQLASMQERRRQSIDDAAFSGTELAEQSRRWRVRVEVAARQPSGSLWSWRVAAVSVTLALGFVALLPREQRQPPLDDQALFEDAFRKVTSVEPAPFAPLESLFERGQ